MRNRFFGKFAILCVLFLLAMLLTSFLAAPGAVTLKYLGIEAFVITAPDGTTIVCDPYNNSVKPAQLEKFPLDITAQVVTVSHSHPCHTNYGAILGNPTVLKKPGSWQFGDVKIKGYIGKEIWYTVSNGVIIFVFEVAGVKIVHFSSSTMITDPDIMKAVSNADVLMFNGGGVEFPNDKLIPYMKSIGARTIIPGHYAFSADDPSGGQTVDKLVDSLPAGTSVVRVGSEIQVVPGMPTQVMVMTPSTLKK